MKKRLWPVIVLLFIVAVSVAGFFGFHHYFIVLEEGIYPRSVEKLDLSGQQNYDPEMLIQLTGLRELDMRDTGLTVEEYEYLKQHLPNCEIHWLLPFQESHLPLNTQQIQVSALTEYDISLLHYLPDLKTIDATASTEYAMLLSLQENNPQYEVLYRLPVAGSFADQSTVSISTANIEEITNALLYLPGLTAVDATGCTDYDALLSLREQYPQCTFAYSVPFLGNELSIDATEIHVAACSAEDLASVLPHLKQLQTVSITEPLADPSGMLSLRETYPHIEYTYSFAFLDQIVSNRETSIDISGYALQSVDFIDALMPHFVCLEKVDMCDCGISDEEMGALNERHPDTLFVWIVSIGRIRLRTDSTYLMPFHYGYDVNDSMLDNMKYLTELICLDFGHMPITRTDYLAYMPNMQYLILAVSDVHDLTPLANMKELKYLELFLTDVKDLSPLLGCEKLEDLNIGYTHITDITPLLQMKQLKNLWFCNYWNPENMKLLKEALPDTKIVFEGESSTGGGWRKLPNYYAQRDILGMYYMIED